MLEKSIIRIASALTGALLLAGCAARLEDPVQSGGHISFRAGSALLRDDVATKADTKESFSSGDSFSVFGIQNSGSTQTLVFGGDNGVTVTKSDTKWSYNPLKSWQWSSTSDYYDFVAIYPSGVSTKMDISGDLAVSTAYDITSDNYDLMSATYRRKGSVSDRYSIVNLEFGHITSAVNVVILNKSESTSVKIDSIGFKNLMAVGDAKTTMDLYGNDVSSWINLERSPNVVRKVQHDTTVIADNRYEATYDFMIPQRLDQTVGTGSDEADMPRLLITYTPEGGVRKTADICLKDVLRQDETPITSWEMGTKYTYYVSMRLDGGLLVSIITTAWEDVEAETPGLLIP